jgi:hypothetical protein
MIRIDREIYLKHTVTDLETLNEPSSSDFHVLGNYSHNSDFKNLSSLSSDVPLTQNSKMNFQEFFLMTVEEIPFCQEPLLKTIEKIGRKEETVGTKKLMVFSHDSGPCTLMGLSHKKGWERGASSLIQKVNEFSCLVD